MLRCSILPYFRHGYARCTHEYTRWTHGYSRWLCEYSRFLHGFRGSTTLITLSTVLIRCVDGSGTAERRGNLRFGQPYRTAAVVVHFNAAFFAVICKQQLKLDNMQSEDVDTLFPQSNKTQLLRRCVMELPALTAGAAMVIVRTKRQKEAELAARERRNLKKKHRILWVKK